MIRVHFAEREPIDYDANDLEFTAAGGVIVKRVQFKRVTNPQNVAEHRLIASNPQVLDAWSRDARWTRVENLDPDAEAEPVPAALEVLNA